MGSGRRAGRIQTPVAGPERGVEPVPGPLPDVPRGVVQSVAVRGKGVDRTGTEVAVVTGVLVWKPALPDVHPMLAAGLALVAPRECGSLQPATGSEFPLRLGRKALARPGAEVERIVERFVEHRLVESING